MSRKRFQQSIALPTGTFTSFINGNEVTPNNEDVHFQMWIDYAYYLDSSDYRSHLGYLGFRSYIDLSQEPKEVLSNDTYESDLHSELSNDLQPNLLPGERTIFNLDKVLKFNSFMNLKQGVSGALHITNYKLSFVTSSKLSEGPGYTLQNSVTCENDIPFTNIDCIYQARGAYHQRKRRSFSVSSSSSSLSGKNLEDALDTSMSSTSIDGNGDLMMSAVTSSSSSSSSSFFNNGFFNPAKDFLVSLFSQSRKKKMLPGNTIMQPCKYLIIHCRDFKIHSFGFKLVSNKDQIVKLLMHIAIHAFPVRGSLLFAFEYASDIENPDSHSDVAIPMFSHRSDWEIELRRLHCDDAWRVTAVNDNFTMSTSLPKYFVVPRNVTDVDLLDTAARFEDDRILCWCYTSCAGTSLVRMSCLKPGMNSLFTTFENSFVESVKMTTKTEVEICELSQFCPSLKEINMSGEKLRELCMTDLIKDFWSKDNIWLSSLEETKWLNCVQRCLKISGRITKLIDQKISVIIKEAGCRDLACLISSLVHLLSDPHYRTIHGFQSLIQREWVAMGHPFQERCGMVTLANSEKSPVFLLFLDCVWQLLCQFPVSFEFSETYLTILWDSIHTGLFHTFLFNSQYQESMDQKKFWSEHRQSANKSQRKISCLPSIWKWTNLLEGQDQALFYNPLYVIYNGKSCCPSVVGCPDEVLITPEQETVLYPQSDIAFLRLWSQCYIRWLHPGQINGGGRMSLYLQQCLLVEEVLTLQKRITELNLLVNEGSGEMSCVEDGCANSHLVFGSNLAQENYEITSAFPFVNGNAVASLGGTSAIPLLLLNSYIQGSSVIQSVSTSPEVS